MSVAVLLLAVALAQGVQGAPAGTAASSGNPEPPGDVELSVALTPESPTVGDRVTAVLTLTVPAESLDGEPEFPAWGPTWGTVEIFDVEEPRKLATRQGTVTWRQRLELAAFRPGSSPLSPVTVRVPLESGPAEVATPEGLALEITSVLPVQPEAPSPPEAGATPPAPQEPPEPRPPEPPRRLPLGTAFYALAAALGTAFLGLMLFLWLRPPPEDDAGAPSLSPWDELEQRLQAVQTEISPTMGHVALSMALRRYLKRRLGFPAAESTTTEIRRQLAHRHLPDDAVQRAVEVLSGCDLVKFAGLRDAPDQLAEALTVRVESARTAARRVESHLRPLEAPEKETA